MFCFVGIKHTDIQRKTYGIYDHDKPVKFIVSLLIYIFSFFCANFFYNNNNNNNKSNWTIFLLCAHIIYVYRSARETVLSCIQFTPRLSNARHIVVDAKRARTSSNSNNILPRLFVFVLKSTIIITTTTTTTTLRRMISKRTGRNKNTNTKEFF